MEQLIVRFLDGFSIPDPETILNCFWPDAIIVSSEFPQETFNRYAERIRAIQRPLKNINHEIVFQDDNFITVDVAANIDDVTLRYYITSRGLKREGKLRFVFILFTTHPDEPQKSLAWIASRLSKIEKIGLIDDIHRLELEREVIRLEKENQELCDQLSVNNNLIATGLVEKLNPHTNPAIFRLTGYSINQAFFIDPLLLKAIGLKNGLLVKVKHSDPVPNNRGQGETKFWMVRDLEIIEMLDRNEPDFK